MSDQSHLDWPFFDAAHRELAPRLEDWASRNLEEMHHVEDIDAMCRELVRKLGGGGWLRYAVPAAYGGALERLDSRALCLIRETLARHAGLADFYTVFARTGGAAGSKGLTALLVDAGAPGLKIGERIDVTAPHPFGNAAFSRLPRSGADLRRPRSAERACRGAALPRDPPTAPLRGGERSAEADHCLGDA